MSVQLSTPVIDRVINEELEIPTEPPEADWLGLPSHLCEEKQINDRSQIPQNHRRNVSASYDGSNVVYRLLRMESWGPALMNLGFYRFKGWFALLNFLFNMEFAQRRLVMKAIDLLQVQRRDRILDIACGRGKSSFIASCMYPEAKVLGMDLLPGNVEVARTLFDQVDNLSYEEGNAMELAFRDESFDRVMCLEAAFHFPDRTRFVREASRVLRPGGRLVMVDFAWKNDGNRNHRDDPEMRLVRDIWQWDDMFSIDDYLTAAQQSGLKLVSQSDWSWSVTHPIQCSFEYRSAIGNSEWGRRFLEWKNPLYKSFSIDDWKLVSRAVKAHKYAQQLSKYMAFTFEKL